MSKDLVVVLPQEVEQLAKNVSVEKRNEVQSVLNNVFTGVSKMREQLDSVEVADENDKVNMKLANTIRLGIRAVRLDAEKVFDAKRSEVQAAMMSFKTEDALWLKAKQVMQILTKEIEENAKWKEATKERIEAERKELKTQERENKIAKFDPEISRSEFENMSDETFGVFLAGIEKKYNDRIAAEKKAEEERIEAERIEKLESQRRFKTSRLSVFIPGYDTINFGTMSEKDYDAIVKKAIDKRTKAEAEQERIRIENEKLKKQQEEAEKKRIAEEEKARKEREKLQAELKKQQEEKDRIIAENKARELAEQKAKEAAEKAQKLEAEKAKISSDKEKLDKYFLQLKSVELPSLKNEQAIEILNSMMSEITKIGRLTEKL